MVTLNPVLVKQQQVHPEQIDQLYGLHEDKDNIFEYAENWTTETAKGREKLKIIASHLELVEFAMQLAWGFELDRTKHSWWCELPGCTCDSRYPEFRGTATETCPIHTGE